MRAWGYLDNKMEGMRVVLIPTSLTPRNETRYETEV
jgi:hypothetical protein